MRTSITRATAAALLACTACQTYTVIDPSANAAGTDVRVTLTDAGATALAGQLGNRLDAPPPRELEGRLQSASDSAIAIAVSQVTRPSGVEDRWNGERVTIPRSEVARVERKSTSVARSSILGIALVSGAYLIGNAVGGTQATGTSKGTPPPPPVH